MAEQQKHQADRGQQKQMIQERTAPHDHRQAEAREGDLLETAGIGDEHRDAAIEDLGEQTPSGRARHQMNGIGGRVLDALQADTHHLRQDQRQDRGLRQRIQDMPRRPQSGAGETALKLGADRSQDEVAETPERANHAGGRCQGAHVIPFFTKTGQR